MLHALQLNDNKGVLRILRPLGDVNIMWSALLLERICSPSLPRMALAYGGDSRVTASR